MAGSLTFRQALPEDRDALERLFALVPMGHHIRLVSERSPDFFATTRIQSTRPEVHGYFDADNAAVGLFSAGGRDVWLDGVRPMRYLSDLRIHPGQQRSGLLARGFRRLREEVIPAGEWAQTLVLEDNKSALALLQSGRAGLPEYRAAGHYASWLMPPQRRRLRLHDVQVRETEERDLDAMKGLYLRAAQRRSFAPVMDFEMLRQPGAGEGWLRGLRMTDFLVAEHGGTMLGMMGLWDQGAFQRLRVQGYSRPVRFLRPFYNRVAMLPLPPVGTVLAMKKLTAVACENDDPSVLVAMLDHALRCSAVPLLGGCSAFDPLVPGYAAFRAHRAMGRHFLVGWDGLPPAWREPFAFDVARI